MFRLDLGPLLYDTTLEESTNSSTLVSCWMVITPTHLILGLSGTDTCVAGRGQISDPDNTIPTGTVH